MSDRPDVDAIRTRLRAAAPPGWLRSGGCLTGDLESWFTGFVAEEVRDLGAEIKRLTPTEEPVEVGWIVLVDGKPKWPSTPGAWVRDEAGYEAASWRQDGYKAIARPLASTTRAYLQRVRGTPVDGRG